MTTRQGGLVHHWAECQTCGKDWSGRNAHGVGARHAQLTGHHVQVEMGYAYTYNVGSNGDSTTEVDSDD